MEEITFGISFSTENFEKWDYRIPKLPIIPRKGEYFEVDFLIKEDDFTEGALNVIYSNSFIVENIFWNYRPHVGYIVVIDLTTEEEYIKRNK